MNMHDVILKYLDGDASREEVLALEKWIELSPENSRIFAKISINESLFSAATERVQERRGIEEEAIARAAVMESMVTDALEARRLSEIEERANQQLAANNKSIRLDQCLEQARANVAEPKPTRNYVIPLAVVYLGIAAAVVLAATTVFYAIQGSSSDATAFNDDNTSQNDTRRGAPEAEQPVAVAHLVGSVDAQWSDGRAIATDSPLFVGDTVRLDAGFVEFVTTSGTTVTLEGPCALTLIEGELYALHQGRLVAHVTHPEKRFTVQTPHGNVVDLGTVFGVEVSADHATQVAVFDGLVEIHSNAHRISAGDPVRLREGRMAELTQDANNAVVSEELDAHSNALYARSLDDAQSPSFHYRRAVLADDPIMYWGFGDAGSEPLISAVHAQDVLTLHGNATINAAGDRRWLHLQGGSGVPAFAELPGVDAGLRGAEEYTLECWARAGQMQQGTLISCVIFDARNLSDLRSAAYFQFHDYIQEQDRRAFRFVHRNPPADTGPSEVVSYDAYETGRWMHVVAVKTSREISIYVDGELVATNHDATTMTMEALRLRLGAHNNVEVRQFEGDMDEVAIYSHALTAAQIESHYQEGLKSFGENRSN